MPELPSTVANPLVDVGLEQERGAPELVASMPTQVVNMVLLRDELPVHGSDGERDVAIAALKVLGLLEAEVALELDAGKVVFTNAERARHLRHPQVECPGRLGPALEPHGPAVRQALARATSHHGWIQAVHIEHDALTQLAALKLRVDVRPATTVRLAYELVLLGFDIGEPLSKALAPSAHVSVVGKRIASRGHLVQTLIQELTHNHGGDKNIVVEVRNLLIG